MARDLASFGPRCRADAAPSSNGRANLHEGSASMVLSARHAHLTLDAVTRSPIFILKALPWTSGAIDKVTPRPVIEHFAYPGQAEGAAAEVFRPAARGPHPAVVVSLGVVPAGIDHPQRTRLGEALARAGFATLL